MIFQKVALLFQRVAAAFHRSSLLQYQDSTVRDCETPEAQDQNGINVAIGFGIMEKGHMLVPRIVGS